MGTYEKRMIDMCEICHKNPCDIRCPNAEMPPIVHYCKECGYPIYDGEEFYNINGKKYCSECMESFKKYAEMEEIYYDDET